MAALVLNDDDVYLCVCGGGRQRAGWEGWRAGVAAHPEVAVGVRRPRALHQQRQVIWVKLALVLLGGADLEPQKIGFSF